MGNLLVEKRRELNLTLKELAERLGTSPSVLYNWEAGNVTTISPNSWGKVIQLAGIYGCDPKDIQTCVENNYIRKHNGITMDKFVHGSANRYYKDSIMSSLRRKRTELGYDCAEVAETIGISRETLNQWELGYVRRPADKTVVINMADLYGWGINETYARIEEAWDQAHPGGIDADVITEAADILNEEAAEVAETTEADWDDGEEESIIDIAQETADNLEEEPIVVTQITAKEAVECTLTAIYAWVSDRRVYDEAKEALDSTCFDEDTLVNNTVDGILYYISSKIYGFVSFESYVKTASTIKDVLEKQKHWDEIPGEV